MLEKFLVLENTFSGLKKHQAFKRVSSEESKMLQVSLDGHF